MTPAGFYSVFFRGSQAPQGRPGRFFSGDGRKERTRGCHGLCPAWREGCRPEDTVRGCPCVLTGRALLCRPDSERPGFAQALREKAGARLPAYQGGNALETTGASSGHGASFPSWWPLVQACPPAAGADFVATGPCMPRIAGSSLLTDGRPVHKKDLTAAGEWHTHLATPRCGVHVGK